MIKERALMNRTITLSDEERDEFFLQGIDNMPEMKKEEKNSRLAMSYNDIYYDDDYETNEDEVQLKEIIELGNQIGRAHV